MADTQRTIDYGDRGTVIVVPDADALARIAAETFITTAAEAVSESRQALVALSGGSTPKRMGELLATSDYADRVHWDALQIFWGDERWVPLDDSQSNAGEAIRTFIEQSPIPDENVHPWETEGTVTPAVCAERYGREIREVSGVDDGVPSFDLIFLGMGDDGHTLSLFPGTKAIHDAKSLTIAHFVAKLDTERVTFGPALANAAKSAVFLVGGSGKAEMLHRVLDGEQNVDELPSQAIRPTDGLLLWLVDEAAASQLERESSDE
ncbi:MAG TPA: 6-phosphogluconolactonase [Thermomicrobiales bacterium]|nr:6-phosphogluconolactonase [Thermomicrobiales bacterium]